MTNEDWKAIADDIYHAVWHNIHWCECREKYALPEYRAWRNDTNGTMPPSPMFTDLCPRCRAVARYERVVCSEEWNKTLDEIEIKALGKVTTR